MSPVRSFLIWAFCFLLFLAGSGFAVTAALSTISPVFVSSWHFGQPFLAITAGCFVAAICGAASCDGNLRQSSGEWTYPVMFVLVSFAAVAGILTAIFILFIQSQNFAAPTLLVALSCLGLGTFLIYHTRNEERRKHLAACES